MHLPSGLERVRGVEGGSEWLAGLATAIATCVDLWALAIGEPFDDSSVAWVAPATLPSGEQAVLKLQFPHEESEHEAEALRRWAGDGAIRLLDHHEDLHALLLEACHPGEHLSAQVPTAAIGVLIGLLPRLWVPAAGPFRSLAEEAEGWVSHLPGLWENAGRPFERSLLEEAIEALTVLSATQGEQVLVHQDLHGDNVLSAVREPWLVIDPKPLVGEREFALAPIIRSYELGHDPAAVIGRLDRLTSELGLDRERARLWALGQTVAWSMEGTVVHGRHVETARWLADAS